MNDHLLTDDDLRRLAAFEERQAARETWEGLTIRDDGPQMTLAVRCATCNLVTFASDWREALGLRNTHGIVEHGLAD